MALKVLVDWDNNFNYTGTYDDITADVTAISWKLGFRAPYQDIADESTCKITLANTDGKYNPENSSSPLHDLLLPQRRTEIRWVPAGGGTTVLWAGFIEFPSVTWETAGAATGNTFAQLNGIGFKSILDKVKVNLPVYTGVTGDVILTDVLSQAIIPANCPGIWILGMASFSELGDTTILMDVANFATIETGTVLVSTGSDPQITTASQMIADVTMAERGRFFIDRSGECTWWNRHHLLTNVADSGTVVCSTGDFRPTQIEYTYGELLSNVIEVTIAPPNTDTAETLWELPNEITIPISSSSVLFATLRRDTGQYVGASTLVASPTFSQGTATVTVIEYGNQAEITLTNASSTLNAILTSLTLSGAPTVQQNQMTVHKEDTATLTVYGERQFSVRLGALSTYADAEFVADYELFNRKAPIGMIKSVKYARALEDASSTALLGWPIGTRLAVSAAEIGHSADYFVMGEEHSWAPGANGGYHEMTLRLEQARLAMWVLGDAGYSELSDTTTVGY